MTIELQMLVLSIVLGLVQIVLSSHSASRQHGYRWAAGSRDEIVPPLQGVAGRLERALRNFAETFPLFAAAVLVAGIANRHSWMTVHGSELYFIARVAYVPLYAFGVRLVRSFVWNAATMGIVLILIALL
jgi:uncharacterized MAPEG superfamily protein